MNIGIIGYGYVGQSIESLFKTHYKICFVDEKISNTTYNQLLECPFIFICVPTPSSINGACDTSIVKNVVNELAENKYSGIIVIKSTIPPELITELSITGARLVFSPEFAGENKYWSEHKFLHDIKESPFFIFGGPRELTSKVVELFQTVGGPEKKYIQTSANAASLAKYINNSFFALKVAYYNEIYDLCSASNVDYNEVRELCMLDPRNSRHFTSVFPDNRGFGGKCFPKDSKALVAYSAEKMVDLSILRAAIESNKKLRRDV